MRITFAALLLSVAVYGQSQDSTSTNAANHMHHHDGMPEKNIRHEIGTNATFFIKQVFSLSNNTLVTQPYQLTYKLIVKEHLGIRVGLGANLLSQSTTVSGSTTPRETNNSNFFGRLGVEYRQRLGRRFVGYAGVDVITQLVNSKTTTTSGNTGANFSQTVVSTDKNNSFGGGPVLGIQYYITKRMSFYTELPISFMMGSTNETVNTTTTQDNGFGQTTTSFQSTITNGTSRSLNITIPVTIYFAVKF